MRTGFLFILCFFVAFGIEARTIKVHKIISDENRTIGCPELENLAGVLDLIANGQAADSGAYARSSGCIYLDSTHLVAMTGEYVYEHDYKIVQCHSFKPKYMLTNT